MRPTSGIKRVAAKTVAAVGLSACFVAPVFSSNGVDASTSNESTAAGATGEGSTPALDEIVVTAQKRTQNINDVGMTLDVAPREQLQSAGITDVSQLGAIVPGFTATVSPLGYPLYSIRGVNFYSNSGATPAAVNIYLDEAPLPYPVMSGGLLLDVERVEVLKGPQGTLFGQNSTGGAVNVIPAKPTDHFATGVNLDVNNFGQTTIDGFVSGPLTETLSARVALTTTQFGAWQKDILTGRSNGDQNKWGGRVILKWQPFDPLTVSVTGNVFRDRGEVQQLQASLITPAVPSNAAPGLTTYPLATNDRQTGWDQGFNTHGDIHTYQGVLRVDYSVSDQMTLTSLTNYVNTYSMQPRDSDGTSIPTQQGRFTADITSYSQELRLAGKIPAANINYIVGGSYAHDLFPRDDVFVEYPHYSGLPEGAELSNHFRLTNAASAGFANIDYEVVPRVTLTGGVRYTATKQTAAGCTADGGSGVLGTPGACLTVDDVGPNPTYLPTLVDVEQKQNNVSWRGGVNYKITPDNLVYGLVSRGYKAGQFPDQFAFLASQVRPVKQEELTEYEIGTKLSGFDRRLQANLSAFYYDYRDKQFWTYVQSLIVVPTVINIPKSSVKGLDFDFTARPVDGLTLHGAVSYVKTKIDRYSGFNYLGQPTDFSGSEFNFAPPVSVNFDVEYSRPVGRGLEGYIGTTGDYNSRTYADLAEPPEFLIKSFVDLDARIGVRSASGWYGHLWVRNLTNEYYWSSAMSFGDGVSRLTQRPRTYGISFGIRTP